LLLAVADFHGARKPPPPPQHNRQDFDVVEKILSSRLVAMPQRVVVPELLDHLPVDDPHAMRSRRDLRRINFLMGNERWIQRTLARFPAATRGGIVELGAGDGRLSGALARRFPESPVTAIDLAPAPADLAPRVKWQSGDLFAQPPPEPGGVRIANLFLHHFEGDALKVLGRWVANAGLLVFNEPDRAALPHWLGRLMHPCINQVTRHDMHASISAGFGPGEIQRHMGLDPGRWKIEEFRTWRGSRRLVCWKTDGHPGHPT
jgi:SAM-dependent methyltransferase